MKNILAALAAALAVAATVVWSLRPTAVVTAVVPGRAVRAVPGSVAVQAEYQMELKCETGGRVASTALELGRRVAQGDLLVQIDSGDLKLEIERIEAEYAAARQRIAVGSAVKLELQNAQDSFQNYVRLTEANQFPAAELEKQRRNLRQIEQRVALEEVNNKLLLEGYENTLKTKRRQLEKMGVRAPFDGVMASVLARPGDLIGPGAPIATIISTSRTVEARISEEYFAGVQLGQKATVRFLGYGDQLYDATVEKILPTADPETQRYVVHLQVNIDPAKLVPGITGEVTIVVAERQAQATIPRRALVGNSVLVVADGRVQRRLVETGYVNLTTVEVLRGLKPGELVIVEQTDLFREGQRVKAQPLATP